MWIEIASVWMHGEEFLERYNFLKKFFNIELREELREVDGDYRGTVQKKAFIEIKSLDDFLKLSNVLRENGNEKDKYGVWCDFIFQNSGTSRYRIEVYDGYRE